MHTFRTGENTYQAEGCMTIRRGSLELPVHMLISTALIEDVDSQKVLPTITDITEQKKSEAALRQWADAFEYCAHGIAIGLPTNRILTCNPSFAALHRRNVEEISDMPILDLYAPSERENVKGFILEADELGQVRYETTMIRGDGSFFPVQMDVVSVRDGDGNLSYRVATMQDISGRKRAEESLRNSEERYRSLVETTFDWVWEVDAHGRYTYANPRIRPGMPIIVCSGYNEVLNEKTAPAFAIDGFVSKPFDRRKMSKAVKEVLCEE